MCQGEPQKLGGQVARPRNHTGRTYIPDLFLEQANDLPLPFHHLDVEVDDSPEEMGAQAEGKARAA